MKTYIILDESGAMHLKNERHFVIAGFVTTSLHQVKSVHKNIEKIIKTRKSISIEKEIELKSYKLSKKQQSLFLNELYSFKNLIPVAIIVDKENINKFGASENVAYNFFVKNLLKYLFDCNIKFLQTNKIELRVDNRRISVKTLKDLETFLNWEFIDKNIKITVKYLDSKNNREIQMADYVANRFWKIYNNKIKKESEDIYLTKQTYISKFPYKCFGKNPKFKKIKK